jgi:hypothetical protein
MRCEADCETRRGRAEIETVENRVMRGTRTVSIRMRFAHRSRRLIAAYFADIIRVDDQAARTRRAGRPTFLDRCSSSAAADDPGAGLASFDANLIRTTPLFAGAGLPRRYA